MQSTVEVPAVYQSSFGPNDLDDFVANIVHTGSLEETLGEVRKYRPVAVVAGGEIGVELADALSERLGLATNGTRLSVDKTILAILFAASFFIMNGGLGVYNVMTSTLRQTITPNRLLGRVAAGYRMLVFGGLSLGGLAAAGLGSFTTPRATLWVAALGFMAAAIPIMLSPIPRYKRLPDAAL